MKIAYTYNLRTSSSQENATFDRPETVALISECLALGGHRVDLLDVSGPLARVISRLEASNPDLVFNTAVGHSGRSRESFYPALLEELGLPFVGGDALAFSLAKDKCLCQSLLSKHGILTQASSGQEIAVGYFEGLTATSSSFSPSFHTVAEKCAQIIGMRDFGILNFREIDGKLYFTQANLKPSFEIGGVIYEAAKQFGLSTPTQILNAIIQSAVNRHGLTSQLRQTSSNPKRKVCVGFAFNLRRIRSSVENDIDEEAEFDTPETVGAVREAIKSLGHDVVDLEANAELPSILPTAKVDVVFNIAEGIGGRARESLVPALLDLLQIPYTGSDVTSISICHDKILAKRVVSQAGIATAPYFTMLTGREKIPKTMQFPLIVKPANEGSSKGIHESSVVLNEAQLRTQASAYLSRYHQPLLIEAYLPGREFTVGLLGEKRPQVLPLMEVVFTDKNCEHPVYSFESKVNDVKVKFDVPAKIEAPLQKKIATMARQVFTALGCRDFARIDFRLDEKGNPFFLECNPLPGLTPDFSDLCVAAKAAGLDYRALISEILAPALRRMRVQQA